MKPPIQAFSLWVLLCVIVFLFISRFSEMTGRSSESLQPANQSAEQSKIGRLESLQVEPLIDGGYRFRIGYRDEGAGEPNSTTMYFDTIEEGLLTLNKLLLSFPRYAQR